MEKKQTEMGWVGKVILGYSGGFRGGEARGGADLEKMADTVAEMGWS